jgi:murein DD-endopeptidase MepM/ murein hydrolase activator NlpD
MTVAFGVVVMASLNGGYGNMVSIDYGNGYVTRCG